MNALSPFAAGVALGYDGGKNPSVLRAHGLVHEITKTRRYQLTAKGPDVRAQSPAPTF
jgi:hypothetical protein